MSLGKMDELFWILQRFFFRKEQQRFDNDNKRLPHMYSTQDLATDSTLHIKWLEYQRIEFF